MALHGTLKDFGLADIFQLIGIQRKTGLLTLAREGEEVGVSFFEGCVVYAETSTRRLEERIGTLLVRSGKLTTAQLQEALKFQSTTLQRLGSVLVTARMITAKDLHEVLQVQMTQIVYNLFRWEDGRYHFSQEETVEHDRQTFTPLSAETVLMEGARLLDEWPMIEKRIPSFGVVFRRTREGEARHKSVPSKPAAPAPAARSHDEGGGVAVLDAVEAAVQTAAPVREDVVLGLVDGHTSVQEIIDRTRLADFDACRILYDLLQRKLVEEAKADAAPAIIAPVAARGRIPFGAITAGLLVAASLGLIPWNPFLPWKAGGIVTPDTVRLAASRSRLRQIDLALKVFYLERQALPQSLEALVVEGLLPPAELVDPWGRPYGYRIDTAGYEVRGTGADGTADASLVTGHAFEAAQRLVIEGGVESHRH